MIFLNFLLEEWTFFPILFSYTRISESVLLSLLCFFLILPLLSLGLTSLPACCRILRLHCGLPAGISWNHWEAAAHWDCHIHAAVACRISLLDEIPVCVAASGHMGFSCYLVPVSVWELTPPESFGHAATWQIEWICPCHWGMTVNGERRK